MSGAASLRICELEARGPGLRRLPMMPVLRIERWSLRRDGPLSEAFLQQKVDALGYGPAVRRYAPHVNGAAQSDTFNGVQLVVRGLIKITVDGESAILAAGDLVFIPRGAVRRVEAIGEASAECLEAVCRPDAA